MRNFYHVLVLLTSLCFADCAITKPCTIARLLTLHLPLREVATPTPCRVLLLPFRLMLRGRRQVLLLPLLLAPAVTMSSRTSLFLPQG
jgi:hypothetical protein